MRWEMPRTQPLSTKSNQNIVNNAPYIYLMLNSIQLAEKQMNLSNDTWNVRSSGDPQDESWDKK